MNNIGRVIEADRLLNKPEAARYTGLAVGVLSNQLAEGRGPRGLRVSPRRLFFRKSELDKWMASWELT